jgi:hypothetical protein
MVTSGAYLRLIRSIVDLQMCQIRESKCPELERR